MSTRRFELVDAKTAKFWEISLDGAELTVCFGKIGTKGQTKTKTLANQDAANAEIAKLIKEKTGKGYIEVTENAISQKMQNPRFADELLELRNAGATSILIYYRGFGDDGCFEWDAYKGCNIIPKIVSESLAEFIIEMADLNDLDGMAEGSIGIIHVDLSTGKVYAQGAAYVSIEDRVREFLELCTWAKCKSIKARITVDDYIEVKKVTKAKPASASDFVAERLQSLFGFIRNNECYAEEFPSHTEDSSLYEILLSHCANEGDQLDLEIDVNEGRFKFSGIKGCFECRFPYDSEEALGCLEPIFSFDLPERTK